MSTSYTDPYLWWSPAAHADGCTSDGWDVRLLEREGLHPQVPQDPGSHAIVQVALRAVCRNCHAQYELAADTGWPDVVNGGLTGPRIDRTTFPIDGHQVRPRRIREYWLHAYGPAIGRAGHPYSRYYLTRSRRAPASTEEIRGVVGTQINRLGNTKWTAATAKPSPLSRLVEPVRRAERDFNSPTAAARWIAVALTDTDGS